MSANIALPGSLCNLQTLFFIGKYYYFSLIESMMEKDKEGKIILDEKRAASILRLIKKS